MSPNGPWIAWFKELSVRDVGLAGGKGANLGELTQAGFPVPPGFVVTSAAYLRALAEGGLATDLAQRAADVDPDDARGLAAAAADLRARVRAVPVPDEVRRAVLDAYHELGGGSGRPVPVAVRSSA